MFRAKDNIFWQKKIIIFVKKLISDKIILLQGKIGPY